MDECVGLRDWGGRDDAAPIVLLHGLMGRGRTWRRHIGWLRQYGTVFTFDAEFHRGAGVRPVSGSAGVPPVSGPAAVPDVSTERFVADVAEILTILDRGPAVLIGHSMGGLHAWCTAAEYPELVRALVVEDMSPEFVGQSAHTWAPWFDSWPERFSSPGEAVEMFGPVAGRYFFEAFDRGALHGDIETFIAIAQHWAERDHWAQWAAVEAPTLLIEAEFSVVPPGVGRRMQQTYRGAELTYLPFDGAGHLAHDDSPHRYRGAVEAFLSGLPAHADL